MVDFDLDDIDLDNFNSDEVFSSHPTNKKPQNEPKQDSFNENRPRLRKIKRPKIHNGPLNQPSVPESNFASQSISGAGETRSAPNTPEQHGQQIQGGLIRASDRANNGFNSNPTNYPAPDYMNNYITNDTDADDEFVYQGNDNAFAGNIDTKKLIWVALACVFVGLVLGKFMFSSEQVVRNGLQGVVVNPEVPKGRSRCGIAERTQGCVLYVMNPQRQELNGRDFYDLASQLTGRQRFVIETGNMRYSSVKIKPGNIAQLNIPPLQ